MSTSEQTAYQPGPHLGDRPYAHWGKRVGASLVDGLLVVPFVILMVVVVVATHRSHTVMVDYGNGPVPEKISDGVSGTGFVLLGLLYLAMIVFSLWNVVFRQGRTGYSLGKSVLGIKLVRDGSDQVAGAGRTFLRQLAHILDSFFYIGYLWPLWDAKRQTFADKICETVVVNQPKGS